MIYLDSGATAKYTEKDDVIIDTMVSSMKRSWRNPSSLYASDVKSEIEKCRKKIAKFIGANTEEIIFCSNGSEANNHVIRGFDDINCFFGESCIISTKTEHSSILKALKNPALHSSVHYCNVHSDGSVDLEHLKKLLVENKNKKILVSIAYANGEIGTIRDIKTVTSISHKYNAIVHCDAVQAFGKIPIDVKYIGVDMMSVAAHKISPVLKGVGFLYKKKGIDISPLIYGSQMENNRGGTEFTFGIIGLAKAIEFCKFEPDTILRKRDYFINKLIQNFGCVVNGSTKNRLYNNINVTFPQNISGESLLYTLDLSGIAISTGSACNSKSIEPSPTLTAIGLTNDEAMRTIRITISDDISYEEIDYVISEIDKAIKLIET